MHRAPWPNQAELAGTVGSAEDQRVLAYAIDVTTRIREQRSALKLGFGVPVLAAIRLHDESEALWAIIEGDVYGGNNVSAAGVSFDVAESAPIEVQLTPLARRKAKVAQSPSRPRRGRRSRGLPPVMFLPEVGSTNDEALVTCGRRRR